MWLSDVGLTALLILLFLQIFVLYPLADSAVGKILLSALSFLIVISGVMTVIGTHIWAKLVVALAVLNLGTRILGHVHHDLDLDTMNALMAVVFAGLLVWVILIQVFREGPVNAHRIAGSVAAYLLIGYVWGEAYLVVALLSDGAFSIPQTAVFLDSERLLQELLYFSFVTLTSVGYGDIIPVHPVAQRLAMFEALIGQLFPAILLARLVSLEIESRQERRKAQQDQP